MVTALTSLSDADLEGVGVTGSLSDYVVRVGEVAERAGAEGVICSPGEAGLIKSKLPSLLVVTPGVRLEGGEHHDQKRVGTPQGALRAGADLLVVGRAITTAPDPVAVVDVLAAELSG